MTDLPPGFVLDAPQQPAQGAGGLPPGFVLDGPSDLSSQIKLPGADLRSTPPIVQEGSFLPIDTDAEGGLHYNSNSGLFGMAKRLPGQIADAVKDAATLPMDVYEGKTSPMGDESAGRRFNFASLISPQSAGTRAGARIIPGENTAFDRPPPVRPDVPTAEDLHAAASSGYDTVRNSPVQYRTEAVNQMASTAQQAMERDGFRAEQAPFTFRILEDLQRSPEGSFASAADLDSARKALNKAAGNFNNPTEQAAAQRAIDHLDRFIQSADPSTVVGNAEGANLLGTAPAGTDAQRLASALSDARGNYAAASRSGRLTDAMANGELNAAVANSGQNAGNAMRQRLAALLKSDRSSRGFSDQELTQIEDAARGGLLANILRGTGNMMGGGLGWGGVASGVAGATAAMHAGADPLTAFGIGAGVPALGAAAKSASNAMTRRDIQAADEAVRSRSPLFRQRQAEAEAAANAVPRGPNLETRTTPAVQALIKALMQSDPKRVPDGMGGYIDMSGT